ncbi:FHA domain-containing protein [Rhodoferax sp. 4810]|nr:FHA domain-containing protein [Rhodoferax jenense]
MGLITVFVEMLRGEQKSHTQPTLREAGFQGNVIDKPLQAPQELLRALGEAAAMYRDDHIAGMSAGGTLPYKLKGIVAYVPEPYLDKVAFARQPLKVRVENAKAVLAPVFARHSYINISGLIDWQIRKKEATIVQNDDGFVDAYVAQPDSGIGVEFAFDGVFLTEAEGGKKHPPTGNDPIGQRSDSRPRLEFRVIDDAGIQVESGMISSFPTSVGRDFSDINVPGHLSRVHGKHIQFSISGTSQVCVEHVGSTNGTFLVQQGGKSKEVKGVTELPHSGKLILGAAKEQAKVAVIEFNTLGRTATHAATEWTEERSTNQSAQTTKYAGARAMETKMDTGHRSGKYGVLVLKYSNGDQEIKPIDKLPFTIGREPQAAGGQVAVVRANCEKVSRNHVRIEDIGRSGLHARNLSDTNGCFLGPRKEADGFIWSFSNPNEANAEWLKLGGETLDSETVWGRVHPVNSK